MATYYAIRTCNDGTAALLKNGYDSA